MINNAPMVRLGELIAQRHDIRQPGGDFECQTAAGFLINVAAS